MRNVPLVSGAAAAMIAALVVANPVAAESASRDSYIVLMDAPPTIVMDDVGPDGELEPERATNPRAAARERRQRVSRLESRAAQRYRAGLVAEQRDVQAAATGSSQVVQRYTDALNGYSAIMTEEEAAAVRAQKGVRAVLEDELLQPHTDVSPSFLGLTGGGEAWKTGLDGEGVVVGIIDSGIWPEHASFTDDGSYERPEGISDDLACDFGQTELEFPVGGATTANEYNPDDLVFDCNNKLLGARDMTRTYNELVGYETYASARDADGHGTHVAGTAAGNRDVDAEIFGIDRGSVSGVAHRASVIAYKGLGDGGGYGSDLAGAIDQAVADGVDVINYSIGSSTPALIGPDEFAFLFAADAGVHVATSNGNDGPGAETTGSPSSVPWLTSVGASSHTRGFENTVTLGDGTTFDGVSITEALAEAPLVDAEDLDNELCDPDVAFDEDVTGQVVLCLRGGVARVAKSQAVANAGGAGMILYNPVPNQNLVTDSHYVPATHVGPDLGQVAKDYVDRAGGDATAAMAAAEKVDIQGSVMADFSSRGPVGLPASADIIKPDVTAPGSNILAGNSPTPTLGRPGQLFQSISGTSMSSPHVAGLMALVDQAHPDWSPSAVKSALMTTARQDVTKEDAVTPADPFDFGAGHVDPGKVRRPGGLFQPGIVYDSGFNDYLGFLCDAEPEAFVNPEATCAALADAGVQTDATGLNLASIADSEIVGTTTISRTVTNVSGRPLTLRSVIDAPDGFDVEVSPSTMRVGRGESATFELHVTNDAAPTDEWRFGAITWRGGGFSAHSPIAVKGALFDAPTEVEASGASGSTSFDVTFGYTGEYSAAPHGLAADEPTSGTVDQDPDQSFDPADGFSTPVELEVSDTALLRLVMNQDDVTGPGAEQADLDLFLFDESGTQVDASTSSGTQEFIQLQLPDSGTYTLWVHGWQTGGQELGFTLHTWQVPLTPGTGNLSIDSAPDQAVLGETETIDVSWDGAAAGTSLGAVSHTDPDGLLGLTLVNVEN